MLEKRLFEAYQNHRGLRLTAGEVQQLIGPDDSIKSRLSSVASNNTTEGDAVSYSNAKTWEAFCREVAPAQPEEEI